MIPEAKPTVRSQARPDAKSADASRTTSPDRRDRQPSPVQGSTKPREADQLALSGRTSEASRSKLTLAGNRLLGGVLKAAVPVAEAASKWLAPAVDRFVKPAPDQGPKSAVLESETSRFRDVALQHETSNSFTAEDLGERWKELHQFVSESRAPAALADGTPAGTPPSKDKNHFAERVRTQVAELGDWVLSQPATAKLTPTDIYRKSLEINHGDAFDARLTAHNLVKEVAATESGHPQTDAARNNAISQRLVNIRDPHTKDDGNYRDKMGPWYHAFVVGVVSAAAKGITGSNGAADIAGKTANDAAKQRSDGPGRVGDPQKEAARLWANRAFDFNSASAPNR
ncbi:MAG: hypothetical protein VKP62_04535 [Candidatus Sericytochromatia bacterium]|nr:hypothetical protein [Candidatus Sericytochromatia bacterium]